MTANKKQKTMQEYDCWEWDDYSYDWIVVPCDDYDDDYQPAWVSELTDTVISWGFDPETASAWLEERESTWEQIESEQQAQDMQQMEKDIKEMADKAEVFFSNMMDDLRIKQEVDQQIREEDLTAMLDEGLAKIEQAERDALDRLEWSLDDLVWEMKNVDLDGSEVYLSRKAEAQNANNSAYGYAALTIGAAAILAYTFKRGLRKTSVTQPLLNDDTFNRA